jgi:16S rRNA (adenine1518-N6/adenine1519-N6)-dimethyltransferase
LASPSHRPRKRFGQNFLVDRGFIARIVDAVRPAPGETLVEIGPGLAALTRPLLEQAGRLQVVEIDRDLAARLERDFLGDALTVHCADALEFDFGCLGKRLRIVGNLPYNISTPLLFRLEAFASAIHDLHFMLQKEVVERMAARPGTAAYGRLSVMLQYRFELCRLFDIPPGAFRPMPKVTSSFIRLAPWSELPCPSSDEALLREVVTAAFSQRRKMLRNCLQHYIGASGLEQLGIDPKARAQTLAVGQFVAIADRVAAGGSGAR